MRSGGAIPLPRKGYLSNTCAIPHENKANGCGAPSAILSRKGIGRYGGGISHRAAKVVKSKGQSKRHLPQRRVSTVVVYTFSFLLEKMRWGPLSVLKPCVPKTLAFAFGLRLRSKTRCFKTRVLGRRLANGKPQERLRFRALRSKTLAFKKRIAIIVCDLKTSPGARACV